MGLKAGLRIWAPQVLRNWEIWAVRESTKGWKKTNRTEVASGWDKGDTECLLVAHMEHAGMVIRTRWQRKMARTRKGAVHRKGHWQLRHQWLTPVILATQEAEIRKFAVRSQPGQRVLWDTILKNPSQKNRVGGVAQGEGPEFKPQYCKKKKCQRQRHRIAIVQQSQKTQSVPASLLSSDWSSSGL
jgi:hypothetical protein